MDMDIETSTETLIKTIQHNCHIADARHAGDYTLCVYLLKMREMYRWEQGIDFKTQLTTDDVGDWLTEREGLWDDIEEQDYLPLTINEQIYEPFDNDVINTLLDEHQLVYNAGLGIRCRPHFFIAELEKVIQHDDYTIYISGKEYARDMAAPAAMSQENSIFIRRESLRRVIWEILDDAFVAGLDNPLTRAMSFYDFEENSENALNDMTNTEINFVIQHEIGEVKTGEILSKNWNTMLTELANTQAEIMLRAIRDHLADSLTTLPSLLKNDDTGDNGGVEIKDASLHFYFGNMTAMRKHLAPSLIEAYQHWHETGSVDQLMEMMQVSKAHWQTLAQQIYDTFESLSAQKSEAIENLIKQNKL